MASSTDKWKLRSVLDVLTTSAILTTCGVLVFLALRDREPEIDRALITLQTNNTEIAGTFRLGNPSAAAVLVVYSDFVCPGCAHFAREILPKLDDAFIRTGQLQVAFRNFPLVRLHPTALDAAVAAACAGQQGKFWALHDRLFQQTESMDPLESARAVNLNETDYNRCRTGGHAGPMATRIVREVDDARQIGIRSTPSYVFGEIAGDAVRVVKALRAIPIERMMAESAALIREVNRNAR